MKGDISFPLSVKGLREAHGKPFKMLSRGEGWVQKQAQHIERLLNLSKDTAISYTTKSKLCSILHWGFKVKTNVITILCSYVIKSSV